MIILGIDWASDKHDACILCEDGRRLGALTLPHNALGFQELATAIASHEPDPANVKVILELHDGALLAWLLDQGYRVYGINPKASDRARDRYKPAGGKDDPLDAFVLADTLRNDRGSLRPMEPQNQQTLQIRELLELRMHIIQTRTKCIQRLRDRLGQWAPELNALCCGLDRLWQLDLLARFPLQHDLHNAHINTVNAFIRKHRLCQATADKIRQAHAATPLHLPESKAPALRIDVQTQMDQIQLLNQRIKDIDALLGEKVAQHPEAHILASLPVKADNTQAHLIAGFTGHAANLPTHQQLSAAWGVSALTVKSGKHKQVKCRKAADRIMRQALMTLAFNTAFNERCWASHYYQQKRKNGTPHFSAMRALASKWVKIIRKMILTKTPYNEQIHQERRTQQAVYLHAA